MVPGSTFRYGSSFWRETVRWRAFRMFPIDAAVMPLPSEETTPPVTKTYFDIDDLQGGFSNVTGDGRSLNLWFCFRLQDYDLGLVLGSGRLLHRELGLRLRGGDVHLLQEAVDRVELELQPGDGGVHRHDVARLELAHDLRRLRAVHRGVAAHRHEKDVGRSHRLRLRVVQLVPQVTEVAHSDVVDLDQVDGVAPLPGALFGVVVGRHADHADPGHLVLARPTDLVRPVADDLGVVVVVVLMADGDDLGVHPRQLEPNRGRVRVGDDGRAAASQPEAAVS